MVKKCSLDRAERSLAPPVASLHPDAPRTSTPKRIELEELQEGLRCCTQHCQSFYTRNGQPSLFTGTWPAHLSWDQARRAYRRNFRVAEERFPSLYDQLERPSVYDTDGEKDDEPRVEAKAEAEAEMKIPWDEVKIVENPGVENEDDEEVIIPSVEELLANPTPSTSGGNRARAIPIGVAFPMDKFGSLISHGKNLFLQGAEIDGVIEANLEKLARQTALKHALNTSSIGAKAALMARQGVLEKIEKYKDRIQYLSGQRRRLLEILIAQQEKAEEAINRGIEPTLAQLGLTIEEAQADFDEIEAAENYDPEHASAPEPEAETEEPEAETEEPEAEGDILHLSSNLSEPGLCDPENPCAGEGPCRHLSRE